MSKLLQRSPGQKQRWAEARKFGLCPKGGTRVCLSDASLELLGSRGGWRCRCLLLQAPCCLKAGEVVAQAAVQSVCSYSDGSTGPRVAVADAAGG